MTSTIIPTPAVTPAQLSFLAIYNPSLGLTDETFREQLLFYHSRADLEARAAHKAANAPQSQDALREQDNERLRQLGLAQGMVDFARTFSDGAPVDSVETEKSRIVLKEVEAGWWVLASIDLTRLSKATGRGDKDKEVGEAYEYSAREVSTPALLVQQLAAAHRTFLLHHGPSLDFLMDRLGREKLCGLLETFWGRFYKHWEVLLHGNPAADVLGGLKLAAGGELGVGVGEEEWGSGERAVLEDLVHRTEGLVDMTVSRFGDSIEGDSGAVSTATDAKIPWIGRGRPAEAGDGIVFGGTGAISRPSVRDLASWVQQIYVYGDYAYGVKDHPSRRRRKLQRRAPSSFDASSTKEGNTDKVATDTAQPESGIQSSDDTNQAYNTETGVFEDLDQPKPDPAIASRPSTGDRVATHDHAPISLSDPSSEHRPSIPPPIVKSAEQALREVKTKSTTPASMASVSGDTHDTTLGISNDKWVTYLTFGLNRLAIPTASERAPVRPAASTKQSTMSAASIHGPPIGEQGLMKEVDPMPDGHVAEYNLSEQKRRETEGYFLIGYRGSLTNAMANSNSVKSVSEDEDEGARTVLRTVHVETERPVRFNLNDEEMSDGSSASTFRDGMTKRKQERLRVLIYIRRPFIYAFLFEQRHESLQISAFYQDLHRHLAPLHKPMSTSTSATNVAQRIADSRCSTATDSPNGKGQRNLPVYDLLYDPELLTVHSSIPNIPMPGTAAAEGFTPSSASADTSWSRMEGLNVHSQILAMLDHTGKRSGEVEKSAKTNRGWWVVWMQLPSNRRSSVTDFRAKETDSQSGETGEKMYFQTSEANQCRIAVLVRRASDWTPSKQSGVRNFSGMMGWTGADVTGGSNAGWGPASLAGGMGFDPRKYVEGLLSLSR